MSKDFFENLTALLPVIKKYFGSPLHILYKPGIRETGRRFKQAFSWHPDFQEFFAVKANPLMAVLELMKELGFGTDCSSIPELIRSRALKFPPELTMFSSNNTSPEEYLALIRGTPEYEWHRGLLREVIGGKLQGGGMLNVDDINYLVEVAKLLGGSLPELMILRHNAGDLLTEGFENNPIGDPRSQKYGTPHEKIVEAFRLARELRAKRFGLHQMFCSNKLDWTHVLRSAQVGLDTIELVGNELKMPFERFNFGGGIGLPYNPEDREFELERFGDEMRKIFETFRQRNGYMPALNAECGRYMLGANGVIWTTITNITTKYKHFVLVDANEACIMRPMLYGSYHGIVAPEYGPDNQGEENWRKTTEVTTSQVGGSLCENVFLAKDRPLPPLKKGDPLYIENAGPHCLALTTNYNGRLRPGVLMIDADGTAELVLRPETLADHFATENFDPVKISL